MGVKNVARIVTFDADLMNSKVVKFVLQEAGHKVVTCRSLQELYDEVQIQTQLVIIGDVAPMHLSWAHLIAEVKARKHQGAVVIMARPQSPHDAVNAFKAGCDDYMEMPYSFDEMLARVEAVIRRTLKDASQMGTAIVQVGDAILSIGDLTYESNVAEKTILTPIEYRILEYLMRSPGTTISRKALVEKVWGLDLDDTNRVDVYVGRLRDKIEVDRRKPKYLRTVRPTGYMFQAENAWMHASHDTAAD
jgi:DNA-binding response OmpR family regulator